MTESEAKALIQQAECRRKEAAGYVPKFWDGYIQGIRRALHGEGFDDDKHDMLTSRPVCEIYAENRRLYTLGYRCGIAELNIKAAEGRIPYAH